jgi:hypothetical protein
MDQEGDIILADTRIVLSGLWAALMLTYLLGDVLRIFAGDFVAGEILGKKPDRWMWLLIAMLMLIPIVMLVLTLILPHPAARWSNIIVAIFLIVFNLLGLPYKGAYDNFLIFVSFGFNVLTVWFAWNWML